MLLPLDEAEKIDLMQQAYERGKNCADYLSPGDKFNGAFGSAEESGYPAESFERAVFVCAFLDNLRHPIKTDTHGILMQYGTLVKA